MTDAWATIIGAVAGGILGILGTIATIRATTKAEARRERGQDAITRASVYMQLVTGFDRLGRLTSAKWEATELRRSGVAEATALMESNFHEWSNAVSSLEDLISKLKVIDGRDSASRAACTVLALSMEVATRDQKYLEAWQRDRSKLVDAFTVRYGDLSDYDNIPLADFESIEFELKIHSHRELSSGQRFIFSRSKVDPPRDDDDRH